ncbi:MAG: hypothetical protein ACFFHD_06490 [Promethearchaeota archaeon]
MLKVQPKNIGNIKILLLLLIAFIIFISHLTYDYTNFNDLVEEDKTKSEIDEIPRTSSWWAYLNITNGEYLNNTSHYHNSTIPIEGELFHFIKGTPLYPYNVSLYVDGILYSRFNGTTDAPDGNFTIYFTIPFNLEVYQPHKIEVNVTDDIGSYEVIILNDFSINIVPYINLTLTNYAINNTYQYHNKIIPIEGRLYEYFNISNGISNQDVSLYIDGIMWSKFNDTTKNNGTFRINFTIPLNWNFYQSYKIEVNISQGIWINDVNIQNNFIINIVPYAKLNLTNFAINNTHFYRGSTIPIEGRVYEYNNESNGLSGVHVSLFVNGNLYSQLNATTGSNGIFQIDITIPLNIDLYQSYKIEVNVTQGILINEVELLNHFMLYVKATSIFEISNLDSFLKIPGELFAISGYLRYDSVDGEGIPNTIINSNWFNTSYKWSTSYSFSTFTDGSFSANIQIPYDVYSQRISLNLSYSGNFPYIENSEIIIPNIILFSDVIWQNLEIPSNTSEGKTITIAGQLISSDNESLKIYNRTVSISYEGNQIAVVETDSDGYFTANYTIPTGAGNRTIQISLVNSANLDLSIERYINVTVVTYVPVSSDEPPPYFFFSIIFFPILAIIVGVLIVFGIRYYKKQEKESRVVNLPLESKLINLKILKDTGRLEESLSYLFNAIFMDLINAKYGRKRKETETIRDFAIISVKELKLTPAAVYPFIQKVEEIIYARPYKITDNDFYETCGLFSPIYFQLTGYNFVLNF